MQYNSQFLLPLIKIRQLSCNFLNSISTDISDGIYWSKDGSVNISEIQGSRSFDKTSSSVSKSQSSLQSTPFDNTHFLQSKHPILDYHKINTSNLKDKPLEMICLKTLLTEVHNKLDNDDVTSMDLENGLFV